MTAADFHLPVQLDYLAIFAWALSGAIVGLRKRFDLVGVFVTALLTSIGGGLVSLSCALLIINFYADSGAPAL